MHIQLSIEFLARATDKDGSRIPAPSRDVVEKIRHLLCGLNINNAHQKIEEVRQIFQNDGFKLFSRWFAQYFVMEYAPLYIVHHPTYFHFFKVLNEPQLDKWIMEETYRNIKNLLRINKASSKTLVNDRQLLKNLGRWLGLNTLASDKPIPAQCLNLKVLLMEAYYKGIQEMYFVIPFILKVLMFSSSSQLFPPSCAWMHNMLKILAEIHNNDVYKDPNIVTLKEEIKSLFRTIRIDLDSFEKTNYLQDRLLQRLMEFGHPSVGSQLWPFAQESSSQESLFTTSQVSNGRTSPKSGTSSSHSGLSSGYLYGQIPNYGFATSSTSSLRINGTPQAKQSDDPKAKQFDLSSVLKSINSLSSNPDKMHQLLYVLGQFQFAASNMVESNLANSTNAPKPMVTTTLHCNMPAPETPLARAKLNTLKIEEPSTTCHKKYTFEVPYPHSFEHLPSVKTKEVFYFSETLWVGGFPWAIIFEYDRTGREQTPTFVAALRSLKNRDESGWLCKVEEANLFLLQARKTDVPDIRLYFKDHQFKSDARSVDDPAYTKRFLPLEFAKLAPCVQNGRIKVEVLIQVDSKGSIGATSEVNIPAKSSLDNMSTNELKQRIQDQETALIEKDKRIAAMITSHSHDLERMQVLIAEERRRSSRVNARNLELTSLIDHLLNQPPPGYGNNLPWSRPNGL